MGEPVYDRKHKDCDTHGGRDDQDRQAPALRDDGHATLDGLAEGAPHLAVPAHDGPPSLSCTVAILDRAPAPTARRGTARASLAGREPRRDRPVELLLATLVLGVVQGAVNALLGAGIVAVYRGTGVINFAHGAMAMVSTYVFVTLVDHHAPSFLGIPLAAVIAVLVGIALGVLVDVVVMRPLARQSQLVRIIATLGVLYVLQSFALLGLGGATRSVPQLFPVGGHSLGAVDLSNSEIGIVVISVALARPIT